MKLYYLASPYSHKERSVVLKRVLETNKIAGKLFQNGYMVFSPIAHTHPINDTVPIGGGWEFWANYDRLMIEKCDAFAIIPIEGWQESVGVTAERKIADELNKPLYMVDITNYTIQEFK